MEFISITKAAKKLRTRTDNVKALMLRGDLKFKKIGTRLVTNEKWLTEIEPDNPVVTRHLLTPELNHEYFSYKKKA